MYEDLIQKLQRNDESSKLTIEWNVDFSREEYGNLIQAIASHGTVYTINSSVKSITVSVPLDHDFHRLLTAIASLPSLTELYLLRSKYRVFMATSLDTILATLRLRLPQLQVLCIHVPVFASIRDGLGLQRAALLLQDCTQLTTFECTNITNSRGDAFSPLIDNLLEGKHLKQLHLSSTAYTERLLVSTRTGQALCESKTLQSLVLNNVGLSNSFLKDFLGHLANNASLKHIDFRRNWQIDEKGLSMVYNTMKEQLYVEDFRLVEGMGLREEDRDFAYEQACATDQLNHKSLSAKIESLTRMNKFQPSRKQILMPGNTSITDFVRMINSVSKDLDAIYYLLQKRPELCRPVNRKDTRRSRKRRRT